MSFKLENIAYFQKGFAFKSKDFRETGINIVKVTNLTDESVNLESCVKVSNDVAKVCEKYDLFEKDIIITTVGSWPTNPASIVGKVVHMPKTNIMCLLNQNAVRIRANSNVTQEYLYYVLRNDTFKEYIIGTAQGSANQASITQKDIKNFNVKLPALKEQRVVAHNLSTLDEKIEVNKQINKTLENMAQAIFKQWFVDFEFPNEAGEPYKSSGGEMLESELGMIPEGWEVKEIKEIVNFVKNGTKEGSHLKDRKYNPIDTLPMKSISILEHKPYEEAKSSLLLFEKYDILIGAMRVYFHRVNLAPYKGITRTTTFVLRSKVITELPYNLFLLNLDETIEYAEKTSKGSTMPYAVWENGIGEKKIAYPTNDLIIKFSNIVLPMLEMTIINSKEIKNLTEIRDTLLPKLMSGEIRVPLDSEGEAL